MKTYKPARKNKNILVAYKPNNTQKIFGASIVPFSSKREEALYRKAWNDYEKQRRLIELGTSVDKIIDKTLAGEQLNASERRELLLTHKRMLAIKNSGPKQSS